MFTLQKVHSTAKGTIEFNTSF